MPPVLRKRQTEFPDGAMSSNLETGLLRWKEHEVEAQLPPTAFNFWRSEQGRIDDHDVISHLPCRTIYDWFLTRKAEPKSKIRVALPTDTYSLENYIILGKLMPLDRQQLPVLIELDDLEYYTIDQSRSFRGYWAITESARYWLQQPCRKEMVVKRLKVTTVSGGEVYGGEASNGDAPSIEVVLPSQSRLHIFHRAQLGLLSNLIDVFLPISSAYHQHALYNYSPGGLFNLLSCKPELREYYSMKMQQCSDKVSAALIPQMFDHPFDLELLLSSNFLLPHLAILHPDFKYSQFFKGLLEINNDAIVSLSIQTHEQQEKWMKSAEVAEWRSLQFLWGQPASSEPRNLRYPLELEIERQFSRAAVMEQKTDDVSIASSLGSFNPKPVESEGELRGRLILVENDAHPNGVAATPRKGNLEPAEPLELLPPEMRGTDDGPNIVAALSIPMKTVGAILKEDAQGNESSNCPAVQAAPVEATEKLSESKFTRVEEIIL